MDLASDLNLSRLRLLIDKITDFISYIDAEERYVIVNRAYETWFQRKPQDIIGKTVSEVLGVDYQTSIPYLHAALSGREARFETTLINSPNKEVKVVDVQYIPHIGDGKILGGCPASELSWGKGIGQSMPLNPPASSYESLSLVRG